MESFYLFLCCFISLNSKANGYVTEKVLMKMFGQCSGENDLPIKLTDFQVSQRPKGQYFLSGIINVTEDMPEGWIFKMQVHKCKDIHNLNMCEIYLERLKTQDGCTIFNDTIMRNNENELTFINPRLMCPTKYGIYKMEDCPLNRIMFSILTFATEASVTVKIEGFGTDKKLFCVNTRFDITSRKRKNN